MQPLPTPVSSNTLTQSACMPSGLNHSSYLVPCSAQLLYCYYGCCTAARQIHNMFVKEANGGVMFPAGMKQTCIQRQIHTTCAINTPPGSGVTDTTTTTHTHTHHHQPPRAWSTHTHTCSSHGVPANHQTVPCRVLWWTTRGWGEEEGEELSAGGQTGGHMRTSLNVVSSSAREHTMTDPHIVCWLTHRKYSQFSGFCDQTMVFISWGFFPSEN